jgi:glycosyltransferase involved in cell wall biosynthesis
LQTLVDPAARMDSSVSIATIIPAYNESSFITRCLEGLASQTFPASEIIVVDDSSADDTVQKALTFGSAHFGTALHVARHEKAVGYDIMGNYTDMLIFGWSKLRKRPDYFAICDADTVLHSDYYATILSVMRQDPKMGIGGGELLPEPGMPHWWKKKKLLGVYPYVYGCNRIYRSECWQELVDNHDPIEVLSYVGIDTYHALLARALGWRVTKLDDAFSIAMRSPASLVSSKLKGTSSFVLGYSFPLIVGRSLLNRDSGYLRGWLWAHSRHLPRLNKIQPLVREMFRRRLIHTIIHS